MRGFRADHQNDADGDAPAPNSRRGFTRYVRDARAAAEAEASTAPVPPRKPVARVIRAPQSTPLAPEDFAREIEAWMADAEAEAEAEAEARAKARAAKPAKAPTAAAARREPPRPGPAERAEPSFAFDDDLFDDESAEFEADGAFDDDDAFLDAPTAAPRAHSSRALRFETRVRTHSDALYADFEIDDPDDRTLGEPDAAAIVAAQTRRAHGGRMRAAALFAGALVAAIGAVTYSVEQVMVPTIGNGGISTATIPLDDNATLGMWREALDRVALANPTPEAAETAPPKAAAAPDAPATPAARPLDTGSISTVRQPAAIGATDAISPYLDGQELQALLASRPVKCILSNDDAKRAQIFGSANNQAFGYGGDGCITTTDYNIDTGRYTRRSMIERDAILEISAAFTLEGDQICHDLSHMAVLVLGEGLPFSDALALEEKVKDGYARRGEQSLCYKIRDLSSSLGKHAYRADVVDNDLYQPDRSDPRPFLMRPRF